MARFINHLEVSKIVGFAPTSVQNWAYKRKPAPAGFPMPSKVAGKLLWVQQDVENWVLSFSVSAQQNGSTNPAASTFAPPPRRRGRPRKVLAAQG